MIYKKTGSLRACQLLLGRRKLESTVRYLGIEVDERAGAVIAVSAMPRRAIAMRRGDASDPALFCRSTPPTRASIELHRNAVEG